MRQVGVLDTLNENVVAPPNVLPGKHERGPDLGLGLGVVEDAPHADRADAPRRGVASPAWSGSIGIEDPVGEGATGG